MNLALLSLGSNQQPEHYLTLAAQELREAFGDVQFSPVYRTEAVGFSGPDFLNAAACLRTGMDVFTLNVWLHALEDRHGRRRDQPRFSSRTLDVDIVYFNDLIMQGPGNLRLPRPELKHAFVLKPLSDIAVDFVDPLQGKRLGDLWASSGLSTPTVDPLQLG